jgi:hypothetical protein
LFSLSVLLFNMFMLHHPLEGATESGIKCMDVAAMNKLYGSDPVFIYDPDNSSNRPVSGVHDNAIIYWDLYPEFFREMFVRAFTTGLFEPAKRVTETEWKNALANLYSAILPCVCGAEIFAGVCCWNPDCGAPTSVPATLISGKSRVPLTKDSRLISHHIRGDFDIDTTVGTVVQNPDNPALWGIRNDSGSDWTYIKPDGSKIPVPAGRTAVIAKDAKLDFGELVGEII